MTKEEGYNKMSEGYAITHSDFRPKEYLYMDDCFIIRDEKDQVFENDWDVKVETLWNTGWYIYKGRRQNQKLAKQFNGNGFGIGNTTTNYEKSIKEAAENIKSMMMVADSLSGDYDEDEDPELVNTNNTIYGYTVPYESFDDLDSVEYETLKKQNGLNKKVLTVRIILIAIQLFILIILFNTPNTPIGSIISAVAVLTTVSIAIINIVMAIRNSISIKKGLK